MAVDVFLKFATIKGESKDDKHKDEIDVLSYSWGVSQTGTMSYGGGGGAGKASFADLSFMHGLDKASPVLLLACATGEHIKEATLTARKAGKGQQDYLTVKMMDILVSSVQDSGSSEHPVESVSLNYSKIELEYKAQKADGTLEPGVQFKYDIKANKAY